VAQCTAGPLCTLTGVSVHTYTGPCKNAFFMAPRPAFLQPPFHIRGRMFTRPGVGAPDLLGAPERRSAAAVTGDTDEERAMGILVLEVAA